MRCAGLRCRGRPGLDDVRMRGAASVPAIRGSPTPTGGPTMKKTTAKLQTHLEGVRMGCEYARGGQT